MSGRLQELLEADRAEEDKPSSADKDITLAPTLPLQEIDSSAYTEESLDHQSIWSEIDTELGMTSETQRFDKNDLFKDSHRTNLDVLAHEILATKSGITLNELCQDIAQQHGLKKTSKKQLQYIYSIVENWAGISEGGIHHQTLWANPAQVTDLIKWRGLSPFGQARNWAGLAYEEQLGLAKAALENAPSAPIDWMFKELKLSRRHEATVLEFKQWIEILSQKHS
jgi:hypothetical protein